MTWIEHHLVQDWETAKHRVALIASHQLSALMLFNDIGLFPGLSYGKDRSVRVDASSRREPILKIARCAEMRARQCGEGVWHRRVRFFSLYLCSAAQFDRLNRRHELLCFARSHYQFPLRPEWQSSPCHRRWNRAWPDDGDCLCAEWCQG